jgi:hypothetical protein
LLFSSFCIRGGGRKFVLVPMSWMGESSNPLAGASGPVPSPATIAKYRRSAFEVLKAELKADWEFVGKRLAREITANLFKISYLQRLS